VSTNIYFDTSALAKWYLNELRSEDVENYIQENGPVSISDLTVVEMRSLLARRRRDGSLDPKMEIEVFATFQEDIRQQYLICHPFSEGLAPGAVNPLSRLPDMPILFNRLFAVLLFVAIFLVLPAAVFLLQLP
jgi:hypothetical protein